MGDQCHVLQHPNQQGLLADLKKLAESVGDRRGSEGYDSASGIGDYDLERIARKDSLDSCFSSYNSGDLASVSREFSFGFGAAGLKCTVDCEESLEQRCEAIEIRGVAESSGSESDSDSEDGEESHQWTLGGDKVGDGHVTDGEEQSTEEVVQALSALLHREVNQTFESLSVTDSEAVHVGNVTYILGEVNVKQVVQETSLKQQVFVTQEKAGDGRQLPPSMLRIVTRREWLAQPPTQPAVPTRGAVNLILINHTATEASTKMMTNMMLCRRIQLMHVEGNEWWDIGYNFLVGMDGYVYEARGWGLVGAHTYGYNSRSLGVAFIGCFMQHVPTPQAVDAFNQLVELGVREGHLTPDCRVMANCQCTPSESPGRAFFDLIKTWPRWAETPPPPPWESAGKAPDPVATTSQSTKDTSLSESEHSADKPKTPPITLDRHTGSSEKSCAVSPVSEFLPPKTADKSEDGWDCPGGQRIDLICAAAVASGLDEGKSLTMSRQLVAVSSMQEHDQVVESNGVREESRTERYSQSRGAVTVSDSSNVHLGRVSYVLGPLCVSQLLQKTSVERTITVSRPDQDNELFLVQRKEWEAHPTIKEPTPLLKPVSRVVVCHTETSCAATLEEEARHVQQLQVHALHSNVLQDIAYNFLIGASGYVFEGRGWEVKGGFARGYDHSSLGVAFIGNFKTQLPTPEAEKAFHQLTAVAEHEGYLSPDWQVMAHCQLVTTDSPGRALYQLLKAWPRWAGYTPSELAGLQDVELVSRDQWLANPPAKPIPKLECPVRLAVICHTETTEPTCVEGEQRHMRSLQDFEVQCRGRADLPFHFLVAPSGRVYEGRDWALAPDLSPAVDLAGPQDCRCLSVALLGCFHRRLPAPAALDAVHFLLSQAQRRGILAQEYHLLAHRQLAATDSPGEAFFSLLQTWPRWTHWPLDDADEGGNAPAR